MPAAKKTTFTLRRAKATSGAIMYLNETDGKAVTNLYLRKDGLGDLELSGDEGESIKVTIEKA